MDAVVGPQEPGSEEGAVLVAALRRRGIDLVFSHAMPSGLRQAAREGGLAVLACGTGEAAVAMAHGHASARDRTGVAMAGAGAVAELVAPLAAARGAALPLLALVRSGSADAGPSRALLAGAVSGLIAIADAAAIGTALEEAFTILEGERPGPVALLLAPELFGGGLNSSCAETVSVDPVLPVRRLHLPAGPRSARPPPPVRGAAPTPIALDRLLVELARALGPEGILVSEDAGGLDAPVSAPGERLREPGGGPGCWRRVCPSRALPVAMGACMAAPAAPVACLVGPGLRAGWADLQTARQMRLPLVLVVRNPAGAEGVDHAAIAAACGCVGIRVDCAAEVPAALHAALAAGRPTVVDVLTDS